MGKSINIERNRLDYILTDIMPVEISELFSYGKFYDFLLSHKKELDSILSCLMKTKADNKDVLFKRDLWASTPLKYNILKGTDSSREINLAQPIAALNIYFFIECYQKEILDFLENNSCFSLRYHRKNNDLFYKQKSNKLTEYFFKVSKKLNKGIIQQTGAYFKLHKFNSVSSFTNSRLWQQCNFRYRYFVKVDYKSCFNSIYTHTYKWIIERNTVDSKEAKNSNLFIIIDRVLQNINGKSSNGVIVGPEFSRMISEILLQFIDNEVLQLLKIDGVDNIKDFRIFRYVDDIFIFANSPVITDKIVKTIEIVAQKYLLHLNEQKYYTTETPVLLNNWIEKTRFFSDKIADLFYKKREVYELKEVDFLVKNNYISLDRLKNEISILMSEYPKDRRFIVSYVLSTFLNNINAKKDGIKLFDAKKEGKAFVLLELALYAYSFCPCFDHSQKLISIIVYFDDELDFKNNEKNHNKLLTLLRRYSFIFQKANLNDICNWFIFFYEYKISILKVDEDIILKKLCIENNPILWANYLIYSRYDMHYNLMVLEKIENIIENNISNMMQYEPLLQKEFWYVLIFCNCPYLSSALKTKLQTEIGRLNCNGTTPPEVANRLIYEFLRTNQLNLFFYWGYYHFDTSKQLTYRTYQRTLFKQYKNKKWIELYGSLES